jgi:hypothetical protein
MSRANEKSGVVYEEHELAFFIEVDVSRAQQAASVVSRCQSGIALVFEDWYERSSEVILHQYAGCDG